MAVDWSRGDISHRLSVFMLDPSSLSVRGQAKGVVASGELSLDYYSDTRASADISIIAKVGDQPWDGTAAMRLVRTTYDYTGILDESPLGTFFVKPDENAVSWSDYGDMRTWTFQLVSILYGIKAQVLTRPLVLGKGAKALSTVKSRFKSPIGRTPSVDGNAKDYRFSSAVEYDAGTSELSVLMDILDKAGDRLSVNELGTPTVKRYTAPSKLGATFTVDSADPRTLLVGPVDGGVARQAVPERVIVSSTGTYKDEQKTFYAYAKAKSGHWSTRAVRGYTLDDYRNVSDMEPFTQAQAQKLANQYLKEQQDNIEESLTHSLLYRPLKDGDVEKLTHGGETRRWLISSADLDLSSWVWRLQLKGGWS